MLDIDDDIKKSQDHVHITNSLYHLNDKAPLGETIRERQLGGRCICMLTDEPVNRFVVYESKIRSSLRPGAPRTTYLHQISTNILTDPKKFDVNDIRKMVVKNFKCS